MVFLIWNYGRQIDRAKASWPKSSLRWVNRNNLFSSSMENEAQVTNSRVYWAVIEQQLFIMIPRNRPPFPSACYSNDHAKPWWTRAGATCIEMANKFHILNSCKSTCTHSRRKVQHPLKLVQSDSGKHHCDTMLANKLLDSNLCGEWGLVMVNGAAKLLMFLPRTFLALDATVITLEIDVNSWEVYVGLLH